jgi:hypothetical protein
MDDFLWFNIKYYSNLFLKKIKNVFIVTIVFSSILFLFLNTFQNNKNELYKNQDNYFSKQKNYYNQLIALKKQSKEAASVISIIQSLECSVVGQFCSDDPDGKNFYSSNNLSTFISSLIVFPFSNPPSSFVSWTQIALSNAGIIPKTYAYEGVGFNMIRPIMDIWKIFRDFTFLIVVLVLVSIGFMIMFRAKINPQTVISIENALPKIIISLILITFSFAFAGIVYDLINIITIIIISLLAKNQYYNVNIGYYQSIYLNSQDGSLFQNIAWKFGNILLIGSALLNLSGPFFQIIIKIIAGLIIFYIVRMNTKEVKDTINAIVQNAQGEAANQIPFVKTLAIVFGEGLGMITRSVLTALLISVGVPLLISILILLTGLYIFIKIIVLIFRAYIENIILIIISPIYLLLEAVPGKNSFFSWLKNIFGNLLIFPITMFIIILSNIILYSSSPYQFNIPFFPSIRTEDIAILVSFGLTFLIPDLYNYAKEALGIKKSPISFGLGSFFAGAGTGITGATQTLGGLSSFMSNPIFGQTLGKAIPENVKKIIIPQTVSTMEQSEFVKQLGKLIKTSGINTEDNK